MLKYFIIYTIICIIEAFLFKKMHDDGYIEKIIEDYYGQDAWKEKVKYRLPDVDYIIPVLVVTFFICSPIIWIMLLFGFVKKLFSL